MRGTRGHNTDQERKISKQLSSHIPEELASLHSNLKHTPVTSLLKHDMQPNQTQSHSNRQSISKIIAIDSSRSKPLIDSIAWQASQRNDVEARGAESGLPKVTHANYALTSSNRASQRADNAETPPPADWFVQEVGFTRLEGEIYASSRRLPPQGGSWLECRNGEHALDRRWESDRLQSVGSDLCRGQHELRNRPLAL